MKTTQILVWTVVAMLCAGPALAEGKGHDQGQQGQNQDHGKGKDRDDDKGGTGKRHFEDHDRVVVHDYFVGAGGKGHCPPGLAKKHNGCLPPGQAKKWAIGQPLPRDVVYYTLPPELTVQLTPPPVGYRYVRVAGDILMIAAGSAMVVDAIQDLGAR